MHKAQEMVRQLHRDVLNQPTSPAEPQIRMGELRAALILEEAFETVVALLGGKKAAEAVLLASQRMSAKITAEGMEQYAQPDLVEAIDGLCDILVVTYGTAEAMGIDIEPFFDEVHRSNLAKANGPVREDGKRGKPPGWVPPDITGVLSRVLASRGDWSAK